MKKILSALFVLAFASACLAIDSSVIKNTANTDVFKVSYESGVATTTVNGVLSVGQNIIESSTTTALTNGQAITLGTTPIILVSAAAQGTPTITNSIVAANPLFVGARYSIINVGDSNGVLIADSAPVYNTGATLGVFDAAVYRVAATNQIVQISTSNN